MSANHYFIKLGGSLITDKNQPMHPLPDVLAQVAAELATHSDKKLVIGNGAGSFGHYTVQAVDYKSHPADKDKIKAVRDSVRQLNDMVVSALQTAGLTVKALPPHTFIHETAGRLVVDFSVYDSLRSDSIIPVVYGDVIRSDGSSRIIATEEVLEILATHDARELPAAACIYATSVDGVLNADGQTVRQINSDTPLADHGVVGYDVTGGMAQKVAAGRRMLTVCDHVFIINGRKKGQLSAALNLENPASELIT